MVQRKQRKRGGNKSLKEEDNTGRKKEGGLSVLNRTRIKASKKKYGGGTVKPKPEISENEGKYYIWPEVVRKRRHLKRGRRKKKPNAYPQKLNVVFKKEKLTEKVRQGGTGHLGGQNGIVGLWGPKETERALEAMCGDGEGGKTWSVYPALQRELTVTKWGGHLRYCG